MPVMNANTSVKRIMATMGTLLALSRVNAAVVNSDGLTASVLKEEALSFAVPTPAPASVLAAGECHGPQYWQNDIANFLKMDEAGFPPANAVLFMGSSSIRMWDLKKYFTDLPVINRGFGGSCISESTYYTDKIAAPYKPRLIVFYSGENDIADTKPPELVAADFETFMTTISEELPGVPVIYISIKPSLARWALWPEMRAANELLGVSCGRRTNCRFLDVTSAMLGEDGKPRSEIFQNDGLHLNDQGYRLWYGMLAPLLETP
jgi:lysophospholipase L1-like esterase